MHPHVLLYDANCPLCLRAKAWLEQRIAPEQLQFVGCLSDERRARFPQVEEAECMTAMQLVLPDGRILRGSDAAPVLLGLTQGWTWAGWLMSLPGLRWLARPVYALIARNRLRISALFFGESCGRDGSCKR